MNILPKKSWHVRTKQNIERVRRDEAKAAEEEKEKERRIALAESEARTEQLRIRARKRLHEDVNDDKEKEVLPVSHINFFREEEEGLKKSGTNAEYEAEKKMEKEKQEKAIGLLTYLGQSAVESQNEKPWYFKPPEKRQMLEGSQELSNLAKKKEEFDLKHKWTADPMKMMIQYLDTKEKVVERDKGSESHGSIFRTQKPSESQLQETSVSCSRAEAPSLSVMKHKKSQRHEKHNKKRKKEHKKKKKHKHKKKKSYQRSCDASQKVRDSSVALETTMVTACGRSVQELRAERIRRENEERMKREQLLAKLRGDTPKEEEIPNEREQRYNSQFNPEFVRKKKRKLSEV